MNSARHDRSDELVAAQVSRTIRFPGELKRELVLQFSFHRLGTRWKRSIDGPVVIRVATIDCRLVYHNPRILGPITAPVVVVRVYDEAGIDINSSTFVGDFESALSRCEDFLAREFVNAVSS